MLTLSHLSLASSALALLACEVAPDLTGKPARLASMIAAPQPVAPDAGSTLARRAVTFSWQPVGGGPAEGGYYEMRVLGDDGTLAYARAAIDSAGPATDDGMAVLAHRLDSVDAIRAAGGSVRAGIALVPGRHGMAVGGANGLAFASSTFLPTERGTVEIAVRLDTDLAALTTFERFARYQAPDGTSLQMLVQPGLDAVYGLTAAGGHEEIALVPASWAAGAWHHLAFTWGPQGHRFYVDGALAAHSPGGSFANPSEAALAFGDALTTVDDIRISAQQRFAPAELTATTVSEVFLKAGAYSWQVRAIRDNVAGPWSEPVPFRAAPSSPQPVSLTGAVSPTQFDGFGVEWDAGHFLSAENRAHGVTDDDLPAVLKRLDQLGVAEVRTFVDMGWTYGRRTYQDFDSPGSRACITSSTRSPRGT